jgi:hypothetical protein
MDLRELILNAKDVPEELMTLPEWTDAEGKPLTVLVCGFDTRAYRRVMRGVLDASAGGDAAAAHRLMDDMTKIVIGCVRDPETRALVFTEEDAEALEQKSAMTMQRIVTKIMELSGMTDASVAAAKAF